jgi:4,5-dihydroxyphthalate decarboxylase
MARLRLTLACGGYDRTRALEDGAIRPDGIELTYLRLTPEETFFRMMRHREFEVAELSLSSYVLSLARDPSPFVALPVYTSRMFRHGALYVRTGAGIDAPSDLVGRVMGTPEFQLTACVWARGILADHYDVPVEAVSYRTGGQEQAGRVEKADVTLPSRIHVTPIPPHRTLSEMLLTGEIDGICSPRVPVPFAARDPRVRRLFPDVESAEREYFAQNRIFPIMHVVVVRRDIYDSYPWAAQSLTKAFVSAKEHALRELGDTSALRVTLPWAVTQLEEARRLLGEDFWSYGLPGNESALATFLRYHHEQGLSAPQLKPEDLFAPESLESSKV